MTQRQVSHASPLPPCRGGHAARHMLDARRAEAGGGHFIECACGRTQKHPTYAHALREWNRVNGTTAPLIPHAVDSNVVQLGLGLALSQRGGP